MIRAKKSLGQNFLKNKEILKKMVERARIKNEKVVEIGPGKGALTDWILKNQPQKLYLIEKDSRLIDFLKEKYQKEIGEGVVEIFEGDVLDFDFKKLDLENQNFVILTNLPYYITGKFLRKIFESKFYPKRMVLLLQKEVVERITGVKKENGKEKKIEKENLLSLSVKIYAEKVEYLFNVGKKNFSPIPKVDSAVLLIENISEKFFQENKIEEREFFNFLKLAFSGKRKKMVKNLSKEYDKEKLEKVFKDLGYDLNVRAEELKINDLSRIFLKLREK